MTSFSNDVCDNDVDVKQVSAAQLAATSVQGRSELGDTAQPYR